MTAWTAFAAVTGLVLVAVLALARSTANTVETTATDEQQRPSPDGASRAPETGAAQPPTTSASQVGRRGDGSTPAQQSAVHAGSEPAPTRPQSESQSIALSSLPTSLVLANVLATHGVLGAVVCGTVLLTGVPWSALGVEATAWSTGLPAVGAGLLLGVGLYVGDEAVAGALDTFGIDYSESLRDALTPERSRDWLLLLGVVLPVVAGFEELLFRAALIGGVSAGFAVSPPTMIVVSTIAFALGHGLQGPGGMLVTGLLGGVLGLAFVLSGSLLLVVVAHYVVNALEFLVHQWLDVEALG